MTRGEDPAKHAGSDLPSWSAAAHARNLASPALRLAYRLDVHGANYLGGDGPLLVVCRSEALLSGSILHATSPRPVHVVANEAMSRVLGDRGLRASGDINPAMPGAIQAQRMARSALEDGRVVCVLGRSMPLGYVLASTGARVAVVVVTGAEGRVVTDPPRPRSTISVYAFEPVSLEIVGDPLRPATRAAVEEQVRQVVADAEQTVGVQGTPRWPATGDGR